MPYIIANVAMHDQYTGMSRHTFYLQRLAIYYPTISSLWPYLMTVSYDCVWWLYLMTVSYDSILWHYIMTVSYDYILWLYLMNVSYDYIL